MARIKIYTQEELDLRREMYLRKRYPNRGKLKSPSEAIRLKLLQVKFKKIDSLKQECIPTTIDKLTEEENFLALSAPTFEKLRISNPELARKIRIRYMEVVNRLAEIRVPSPIGDQI